MTTTQRAVVDGSADVVGQIARPARPEPPPVYRQHHFSAVIAFLVGMAVLVPLLATRPSDQYLVNQGLAYSVAALGFYWVFGLAGRFAFCQTFMMALGGYTSAWVTREMGGEWFVIGLLAGMAASGLLAFLVGIAVRRAEELYFAIATLAVTEVGLTILQRTTSFSGPNGTTTGIPAPQVGGATFVSQREIFWLFLVIVGILLFLAALLERSPIRREAVATRENPLAATASGVHTKRIEIALFVVGSAVGALAGGMIGAWNGTVSTDSFGIQLAIGIFLIVLLGGLDSMWGPFVGAAFYVAVPHYLTGLQRYQTIVYGGVLLVIVILMPDGLAGSGRRLKARVWRGSFRASSMPAGGA